jgi:branched-chain amino acid aminotransferase
MAAQLEHMQIAPYYWFDGEILAREKVTVDPFAHGLHYGSGVFEGIRAYATHRGAAVFRLREHMERFAASAAVYGLELGATTQELCDAVLDTLIANDIEAAYIRPLAFFGEKTISLAPKFHCPTHVLIALRALGNYFGAGQEDGIRTTVSPWRKFSSKALPAHVKCAGHYANSVLAMQDAVTRGFSEAILLNDRDQIAEGTGENVFVVKNGVVRTNDGSADILMGITRQSVLELAADLGIETQIGPLTLDDLLGADEAFFSGTAVEVTPLACVDDHVFAKERPVTTRIRAAFDRAVHGEDPLHPQWATFADARAPFPALAS